MQSIFKFQDKNQKFNNFSEIELLLHCARTHVDNSTSECIKNLAQKSIDWEYFFQTAYRHRVLPLIYLNLNNICPQSVPNIYKQQLQKDQYIRIQRSLILTSKLLKLLELLEFNNIPVIPFKGPVLAMSAYGDISRREFYDLDILVRKQDFIKTKEILVERGYRPYSNNSEKEASYLSSLNSPQQKAYLQSHWELHLIDEYDRVTVDVHHGMLPKQFSFLFDTEWLWKNVHPQPFAHKTILNLPPEELILILCSQGAKDCWLSLNRICDIAQLIRASHKIDWERICELAMQLRMTRILLLGLLLAHKLLEVELPKNILKQIQDNPFLESLACQISHQIFYKTDSAFQNWQIKSLFFHFRMIEHPLDKFRYCFEHLFLPTVADRVFLPLPNFLDFLYYFLRPIRLITIYLLPQQERSRSD